MRRSGFRYGRSLFLISAILFSAAFANARPRASLHGRVVDPLGTAVPGAKVTLIRDGKPAATAAANGQGDFVFSDLEPARYAVRVEAPGFQAARSASVFVSESGAAELHVTLSLGALQQQVVVSATGTQVPASQVGASVSVIDSEELESLHPFALLEPLRLLPGVQIVQSGQRGGLGSVFVRGGNSDFNKVLIDGVPADDAGGAFDFSTLSATGIGEVEVLRDPNSVVYGTDALTSVISFTTQRGMTASPEVSYSADGGNFRTFHNDGTIAGAYRAFDYFSEFSRFDTHDSLPNSAFHDGTYAGNFGWSPTSSTQVRVTLRRTAIAEGDPNALAFYGIADKSITKNRATYLGATLENQTTSRWHNLARFTTTELKSNFTDPSPTGQPFDPFIGTPFDVGPNYLGNVVTIRGANGYSVTGQAILDFAGTYPMIFDSKTTRLAFFAQSDYEVAPDFGLTAGVRYENEEGSFNSGGPISGVTRNNYGGFLEARGSLAHRLYASAGVGFDQNAVFGFAATPRISTAYYLRRPSAGFFSDTKLKFNFAQAIKEPSVTEQLESLFDTLLQVPGGPAIIAKDGIAPIGPERSRSFDFGVEEGLWSNRARLDVSLFHENFYNLIDFVSPGVLPELGVPPDAAKATGFGAYINSDSFRALGAEVEFATHLSHGFRLRGDYTYLDGVVTHSFSSGALQPAVNPDFPGIPIGAFAPLVGARPFDRAPHSGSVELGYAQRKFGVALSGYFVGRRDGSTFLSDAFEGNTMLLPNRNLQPGFQLIDLGGSYTIHGHIEPYCNVTNLISQHYQQEFGYPALPLTFRAGLKFTFGGETGWR